MSDSESPAPEKTEPPRKKGWIGKLVLASLFLLVVFVAAGGFLSVLIYEYVVQPGAGGQPIDIDIPEGVTGTGVGRILHEHGLIEHPVFFRLAIHLDETGDSLKHGPYAIPQGLSPTQVLRFLQEGPNRVVIAHDLRVTIPEGLSARQIAALCENPDLFLEASQQPTHLNTLDIEVPSLEGFLMPNTYFFSEAPTEVELIARMVQQFEKEFTALLEEYDFVKPEDALRLVTIASLIEEEARIDEERPIVASVIYNRLDKNMLLGMDSTLQFALNKYGQRLLSEDKEVDSPYNTYRTRGLPPGPISNPGVASLRAAIAPADTKYLYFVSNADGKTHTFSTSLNEHNRAVAQYRKEVRQQRREQSREENGDSR